MARKTQLAAALLAAVATVGGPASAYFNNDRWGVVASPPSTAGPPGTPVTLTWGFALDGANVPNVLPGVNRLSNLVASLDGWFGDGGGAPIEDRPWFQYFEDSMDRWSEISGVTFVYEPEDDGRQLNTRFGSLGLRADIRLAGARYDGTGSGGSDTLAYAIAPDDGDIFFDTDNVAYYSDPTNNAFNLRHTLMHEVGHALGLGDVTSTNSALLMEPFAQDTFDGPQLDDIRGVQFLYGDALEKGGGNNSILTAWPLGELARGDSVTLGADGATGTSVLIDESDFVSINNSDDVDYFAFTLETTSLVDLTLTPIGATYREWPEGGFLRITNASAVGDLRFDLLRTADGALLGSADVGTVGDAESLTGVTLPAGDYAVRVAGVTGATQLYQLDVAAAGLPGDYNGDGRIDAADYTVWRDALGSEVMLAADGDGNGRVEEADYLVWKSAYGGGPIGLAAPEPGAAAMLSVALSACLKGCRRARDS